MGRICKTAMGKSRGGGEEGVEGGGEEGVEGGGEERV